MSSPIEEIKNRIDIVEFIGSYVRLQKAGVNFKAPCPFHNEKTPSFVVSPARQIWHCFGCAKGGDIFRFIMEIEGLDFPEALKALADRAGIVLKREDPSLRTERNRQISMLEEAARFFEANLSKESSALDYLTKRNVRKETIAEWRVGFAPNEWESLNNHLSTKGFNGAELERAGLAIKSQASAQSRTAEARYYDRFRGRIIFPIFDYQGRVVAFGGRMYPDRENEAKYINSPETSLYQKSKILYGLDKAKTHILKSGSCVIVEGYMDTIMSWQAGVKNVVASSGTALSFDQLKILRRLCEKIIAAFDMDIAGQAAAKRGIELALQDGFDVSVINLGEIKDPADAVAKNPEIWTNAINSARHIVQFYIDTAIQKYKANTPLGKREIEKNVIPVVASLPSDLEKAHWVRELGNLLNIQEQVIWGAIGKLQNQGRSGVSVPEAALAVHVRSRKELLEERVLAMLIKSPKLLDEPDIVLDSAFFSGKREAVFKLLKSGALANDDTVKDYTARLILEAELFLEGILDADAEFKKWLSALEKEYLKEKMAHVSGKIQIAEKNNEAHTPELIEEFSSISRRLSQLP